MGFPTGYAQQFLINSLSLFNLLKPFILNLSRFSGLSHFLEPEIFCPEPGPESKPATATIIQEMLPVMKFNDVVRSCSPGSNEPEQCAVCLYDFRDHEEIRRLTNCGHIFHRVCVDRWMDHDQITCPLCRTPFVPDELMEVFHEKLCAASVSAIPEFGGEFSVINNFL
ncbi:E3 ubiquitin-protein ligase RHA1B-like [Chenopodium quinoa]|uniref:E3 ubiquitin-protein ligase RHA1B-like n=1 Tax=Chenopodium quinoa TaxID=63459 RepID=UPI000B77EFF0|nr:E3 ubiquitin-protein ligase RHA1B-like [Chenopodium quinoa]